MPKKTPAPVPSRFLALDYLRGYFIAVIIVDHMWRFPSLYAIFTGQAQMWTTAAEGFVIISGFLIGYVRGYKSLAHSFTSIAFKLIRRALLLYVWMVLASLLYVWLEWTDKVPKMPYTPRHNVDVKDWGEMFYNIATTALPHTWVHFLYLYTAFLLMSVIVIGLLRRRQPLLVVAIVLACYLAGLFYGIEWLKWQILFFGAALAGFYFEVIRIRWRMIGKRRQHQIAGGVIAAAAASLIISAVCTFAPDWLPGTTALTLNAVFSIQELAPPRLAFASLWFVALGFVFYYTLQIIKRFTFGILYYFGTHSLTAYIAHGAVLCLINVFLADQSNVFYNTLLNTLGIVLVYFVIKLPIIRTVLPR